jgi:hypothetical protein
MHFSYFQNFGATSTSFSIMITHQPQPPFTSHFLGGTFSWFLWVCIFAEQHKLLKTQPSFAASVLAVAHREEKCVFGSEAGVFRGVDAHQNKTEY